MVTFYSKSSLWVGQLRVYRMHSCPLLWLLLWLRNRSGCLVQRLGVAEKPQPGKPRFPPGELLGSSVSVNGDDDICFANPEWLRNLSKRYDNSLQIKWSPSVLSSLVLCSGDPRQQAGFSKCHMAPLLRISLAPFWVLGSLGFDSVLIWRHSSGHYESSGLTLLEVISKAFVKAWGARHFFPSCWIVFSLAEMLLCFQNFKKAQSTRYLSITEQGSLDQCFMWENNLKEQTAKEVCVKQQEFVILFFWLLQPIYMLPEKFFFSPLQAQIQDFLLIFINSKVLHISQLLKCKK